MAVMPRTDFSSKYVFLFTSFSLHQLQNDSFLFISDSSNPDHNFSAAQYFDIQTLPFSSTYPMNNLVVDVHVCLSFSQSFQATCLYLLFKNRLHILFPAAID